MKQILIAILPVCLLALAACSTRPPAFTPADGDSGRRRSNSHGDNGRTFRGSNDHAGRCHDGIERVCLSVHSERNDAA